VPSVPPAARSPVNRTPVTAGTDPTPPRAVSFAHASEAEFGRILDFYGVRWEYEPRTFPILWDLDGAVVESFSPDFWLPDLELFVEMTTLRQSLVRKKNRKLRRLRELYPDIRIKLFYGRDFRALMLKYGKVGLIDEMTGTLGQATPAHRRPESGQATADSKARAGDQATATPEPSAAAAAHGRSRRAAARASAAVPAEG